MKAIGALRVAAALLALCLAALLAGCAVQIAPIEPNSVEQIEVESLPQSETWARVYTDRDKIGEVVSYLNGLRLRQLFSENPDEYVGQSLVLTLTLADGTTREFTQFRQPVFDGARRRVAADGIRAGRPAGRAFAAPAHRRAARGLTGAPPKFR